MSLFEPAYGIENREAHKVHGARCTDGQPDSCAVRVRAGHLEPCRSCGSSSSVESEEGVEALGRLRHAKPSRRTESGGCVRGHPATDICPNKKTLRLWSTERLSRVVQQQSLSLNLMRRTCRRSPQGMVTLERRGYRIWQEGEATISIGCSCSRQLDRPSSCSHGRPRVVRAR